MGYCANRNALGTIRTAYNELKGAVNTLMKRTLSWQITDGKKIGIRTTIWVQGYDYFKDEGLVKFRFSEYIFPFLFELEREFTKYQLQQAAALRSIYSWRLLEMFEQMKDIVRMNYQFPRSKGTAEPTHFGHYR